MWSDPPEQIRNPTVWHTRGWGHLGFLGQYCPGALISALRWLGPPPHSPGEAHTPGTRQQGCCRLPSCDQEHKFLRPEPTTVRRPWLDQAQPRLVTRGDTTAGDPNRAGGGSSVTGSPVAPSISSSPCGAESRPKTLACLPSCPSSPDLMDW